MEWSEAARWAHFRETRDEATRAGLIEQHMPLVETVLRTFKNVRRSDVPDLRAAGYWGLVQAVDQWDPAKKAWLDFARFRIRAKMVDQIREMSWAPKSVRTRAKLIERMEDNLAGKFGRSPTTAELAEAFGCTVEEMDEAIASFRATDWSVASLDAAEPGEGSWLEALADPAAETPEQAAVRREELDRLELVLQRLPGKLRRILYWRFFQYPRRTQKAIAQELGVHESRISQLLDDAFARARKLNEQPWVLFAEVYEEGERLTCRE